MKKIGNVIFAAIMVVALVFGFASCGNNASGNGNTNPNEKPDNGENPDDKFEASGTSADGKYSYKISGNNFTLKYTGTNSPNIELAFFCQDASSSWGWSWFCSYRTKYSNEVSINIFEQCWAPLWIASGKRPVTQDLRIEVKENSNRIVFGKDGLISAKLISDETFLDSKDYSKKTFTPVKKTFVEESANDAVAKMKMGANLSNHFECWSKSDCNGKDLPPVIWETSWEERETTKAYIKYLKSLGFTAIRLPVTWWCHLDANDNILPGWLNRIQEVINWCMEENLYVILNTHHDSGGDGSGQWFFANAYSYNKYSGRYRKIWEQLSEYFKEYDERLIFANANEVTENAEMRVDQADKLTDAGYEYMGKWNQLFVDTVRASGGNNAKRNLVFSAPTTMYSVDFDKVQVPNDSAKNHLIFEYHCYDPGTFCSGDYFEGRVNTFNESEFKDALYVTNIADFGKKNNVPVIAGEWGALDAYENGIPRLISSDDEKAKYANRFLSTAMKNGLGTFLWLPQAVFGFESMNDAKNPCPKYLQMIKDWTSGKVINPKPDTLIINFEKAYNYDANGNKLETYDSYRVFVNITEYFDVLPNAGDKVNISCFMIILGGNPTLRIGLVDKSEDANWWKDLSNIKLATTDDGFISFNNIYELSEAPVKEVWMYIDYLKSELDEAASISIF